MGKLLENLKQRLSAVRDSTVRFYRANSLLVLSGFTILSVLLIVWARFGFTLQFGQSEAFRIPGTLGIDVDVNNLPVGGGTVTVSWVSPALVPCVIDSVPPSAVSGPVRAPTAFAPVHITETTEFTLVCPGFGEDKAKVTVGNPAATCPNTAGFECVTSCAQPRSDIGTCAGANFCCAKTAASSVTATLTVTPASVRSGDTVQATWSSTNATTCTAVSGQNFTTNNAKNGNNIAVKISDSFVGTAQFRIRCDGANGAQGFSAIVPVTVAARTGTSSDGGGGANPAVAIGSIPATQSGQALGTISGTATDAVHVNTVKVVIRKNGKLDGTCTADSKDWDGAKWIQGCQVAGLITPTFTPGTSVAWSTSKTPPLAEMTAGEYIIFAGAWRDAYPTQPWSGWVTKPFTFAAGSACVPRPACMKDSPPCMPDLAPGAVLCPETSKPSVSIEMAPSPIVEQAIGTIGGTAKDDVHVNTIRVVIRKDGNLDGTCKTESKDWNGTAWVTGCQNEGLLTPTYTPGTSVSWTLSGTPPLSAMTPGSYVVYAAAWRDAYDTQPWSGWVAKAFTFTNGTATCAATAPSELRKTDVTDTSVALSWKPGTNGVLQRIIAILTSATVSWEVGTDGILKPVGGTQADCDGKACVVFEKDIEAGQTSYKVTGLKPSETYLVVVYMFKDEDCFKYTYSTVTTSSTTDERLSCAPVSQTVAVGQDADVDARGGDGEYRWAAFQNGRDVELDVQGDSATARFSAVGTHTIQVTSGDQATSCRVTVVAGTTPTPSPKNDSLTVVLTGRNVSTNGVPSDSAQVRTGQQVELRAQVANHFNSGNLNNVMLRVTLPDGLSYIPGSTTIRGTSAGSDAVVTDGLSIGGLGAGQDVMVLLRASVVAEKFPSGTTQVQAVARVSSSGVGDASDPATFVVTRPVSGGGTGAVQTGPGEALLAAFLVSAIMTLLYVSYTHTSSYKRKEVGTITRQRDPLDFRS